MPGTKKKTTLMALYAPRAVGKSTLLSYLVRAFGHGFTGLDCSQVCDEHIKLDTPTGRALLLEENDRTSGGLYSDGLVVQAIKEKIGWEKTEIRRKYNCDLHGVFASGIPRKREQYDLLEEQGYDVYCVHLPATLRQVFEGVARRERDCLEADPPIPIREDGSISAVLKSWSGYESNCDNLITAFPAVKVMTLQKELPLLDKVLGVIQFAPLPMRDAVLESLKLPEHPVRLAIAAKQAKIDRPVQLSDEVEEFLADYEKKTTHQPTHNRAVSPLSYDSFAALPA